MFPTRFLRTCTYAIPVAAIAVMAATAADLPARPSAGDLDPLTRLLVGDAGSVLRHIAGLSVHLHGALALIFEGHEHVVFLIAPQHAHVPAPVEQD